MRIKPVVKFVLFVCYFLSHLFLQAQPLKIAVISDLHYMDSSLLIKDGSAFMNRMKGNRVLLKESPAILKATVDRLINENVNLVLITGDLTKDGEYVSHKGVIGTLNPLLEKGIKVLVIPGNHEIDNKHALSFEGDIVRKVPGISSADFRQLYENFGYKTAIQTDTASLSYVNEPMEGLRVLCIDDCESRDKQATRRWIMQQIVTARAEGKHVIGMMHHNVVEHFEHEGLSKGYMTDDFVEVQKELMSAGLNTVFTGHFHANDIARADDDKGNYLYDVETGSVSAYPNPYRVIELSGDSMRITTDYIDSIGAIFPDKLDFQHYARQQAEKSISETINNLADHYYSRISASIPRLAAPFFEMPDKDTLLNLAKSLFPGVTDLIIAHYCGNENLMDSAAIKRDELLENTDIFIHEFSKTSAGIWSSFIERTIKNSMEFKQMKEIVSSIWNDQTGSGEPVNDLTLTINLFH
jgi:3',5'-cyclic AMP phosphodiesterase CpdA